MKCPSRKLLTFALFFSVAFSLFESVAPLAIGSDTYRRWTDKAGQRHVEARITDFDTRTKLITVEKRSGEKFTVPLAGFSDEDQTHVLSQFRPNAMHFVSTNAQAADQDSAVNLTNTALTVKEKFDLSHTKRMESDPLYAANVHALEELLGEKKEVQETLITQQQVMKRVVVRCGIFGHRRRVVLVPQTIRREEIVTKSVLVPYELPMASRGLDGLNLTTGEVNFEALPNPVAAIAQRIRQALQRVKVSTGVPIIVTPRSGDVQFEKDKQVLAASKEPVAPAPFDPNDTVFVNKYKDVKVLYGFDVTIDTDKSDRVMHLFVKAYDDERNSLDAAVAAEIEGNMLKIVKEYLTK